MTEKPAVHGWILLDKPRGLGSTQAVGAVKRNLREAGYRKVKVGHGGTLDPLAEGVLPIALGEATKLAGRMLDSDKVYEFTVAFGEETSTLDAEGEVVRTSGRRPPMSANGWTTRCLFAHEGRSNTTGCRLPAATLFRRPSPSSAPRTKLRTSNAANTRSRWRPS